MSRFIKISYYCHAKSGCCFDDIKKSRKPSVVLNIEHIVALGPMEYWGFCEGNEKYPFRRLSLDDGDLYFIPIDTADILEKSLFENQKEPADKGDISDGYHTFNELYYYRMLYNAAFFNLLPKHLVHKSRRHHDGEECFGGGWFIVMAQLPTGQISNHYELKDWDLFQVPEQEKADEWDGHTPKEAAERIFRYLQLKQKPVVWSQEDERILAGIIGKIGHDQSYGVSKDDMIRLLKSIPSRILYARNL